MSAVTPMGFKNNTFGCSVNKYEKKELLIHYTHERILGYAWWPSTLCNVPRQKFDSQLNNVLLQVVSCRFKEIDKKI